MATLPTRVFFDTNIYIFGMADAHSPEFAILGWAGFGQPQPGPVEVVASEALFEQIARVAKRLRGKDWGGEILNAIWRQLQVHYVLLDSDQLIELENQGDIPREDVSVYLTARVGGAQCFVSANHKLVSALVAKTGDFECVTPEEFVRKYLK